MNSRASITQPQREEMEFFPLFLALAPFIYADDARHKPLLAEYIGLAPFD